MTEGSNRTRWARFDLQYAAAKADPTPDSQFATGVEPPRTRVWRRKLSLRYPDQDRASNRWRNLVARTF